MTKRCKILFLFLPFCLIAQTALAQEKDLDSLKQEILELRTEVDNINLNLEKSRKKLRTGVLVATIGYTVTIAGGLMLGRENDSLGQALLITGGVTGITGTYMMVDAFKFMGRKRE